MRTGWPDEKKSAMAPRTAGWTDTQGISSLLVTATKSGPKKTLETPWIRKMAAAKGDAAAARVLGKSLVPLGKTGFPG